MTTLSTSNITLEPIKNVSYTSPNWVNSESIVEISGASQDFMDKLAVGVWAKFTDSVGDTRAGMVTKLRLVDRSIIVHIRNDGLRQRNE